jgi:hypothetical protein
MEVKNGIKILPFHPVRVVLFLPSRFTTELFFGRLAM